MISQEFPRFSSGVTKVKKKNFPRIPKIVIWGHGRSKRNISKGFSRSNMNTKLFFQHVN
ncbi:hypothetical protein HOLleu_24074 [Holothuria leucospilota]|uniref:Uncharacterized protein n=1 Tax=Holothuria leucospilota TaxID=206669 RepID=A0A9Q1BVQ8_HOLLE|nr:hypothetical protein HOLleu_24074 [Holothuria leucospilota]